MRVDRATVIVVQHKSFRAHGRPLDLLSRRTGDEEKNRIGAVEVGGKYCTSIDVAARDLQLVKGFEHDWSVAPPAFRPSLRAVVRSLDEESGYKLFTFDHRRHSKRRFPRLDREVLDRKSVV